MRIRVLFGWLVVVGPLHMGEQLLTGIEELQSIKQMLAVYLSWFADPDYGIVVLVTIIGTLFLVLSYCLLVGGRSQLVAVAIFGAFAVAESHHFVTAIANGGYSPGVVTAIPFVVFGILLLRAVLLELQHVAA